MAEVNNMTYDFDTVYDRFNTYSEKWDVKENELPMWVADMDFRTAPEIMQAIGKQMEHGIFGYSLVPVRWYDAYILWWKKRYGFELKKEWLMFCTGVIPAVSSIIRKIATPNENVVMQTPVYNCFFNSIINNGCRVLENPLIYKDGKYSMDLDDLEKKLSDPQTNLMILCNPHNPSGNIWDRETLKKIGEIAYRNNVVVISDEIHCDITKPGKKYIPFASVSEICEKISITCIAPTKTFNIAGLKTAAISVPNVYLRNKVRRAINTDEIAEPNAFACVAAIAAYNNGDAWLDAMREYVFENRRIFGEYIKKEMPYLHLVDGEATYLLWLDVSALGDKSSKASALIRKLTGLYVSAGGIYGKCGENFLRINVACPRKTLYDGLERLKTGIENIMNTNK